MAITLVSGLPGAGKTLYTLWRFKLEAEREQRPVFHNDIPGLNIPGWQVWDAKDWQRLPAGALLILDEAWKDFPVRGRGEPPVHVGALAEHRHLGIDIVLIAQDPMLIDSFVRRLCDRHFHVMRKFGTYFTTIHEFATGVRDNVAKSRKDSIRHEWRYSKAVFGWYTSAEKHTMKVRLPARVWLLLLGPVLLLAGGWYAWQNLHRAETPSAVTQALAGQGPVGGTKQAAAVGDHPMKSALEYAESFTPRVAGLPHTAPAYDEVTRPVDAPYPAACISMPAKKRCSCYTQQGTKLDTGAELCEQIAAGGFFVAWAQRVAQAVPVPPAQPVKSPEPVLGGAIGIGGTKVAEAPVAAPDVATDGYTRPRVRR